MARTPKHETLTTMVQYYISLYYHNLPQTPALQDKIKTADHTIKNYLQQLEKNYPNWNTEESRGALKTEIDFLTQIYTKTSTQSKTSRADKIKELFK